MRCVSCGEDIPPKWVAVIEKNVCPSCDGPIMTDDAVLLKTELAEALAKMPNDPQGITGWILSNYRVQKIGKAEPVERFNRPGSAPVRHEGEPSIGNVKVAKSPYEEMLERTQMANKVKSTNAAVASSKNRSERLAEIAANISDEQYGLDDGGVNDSSNDVDEDDVRAYQEMEAQGINPFNGNSKGAALSPQQIAAMQNSIDSADSDGMVAKSNVGRNDNLHDLSAAEKALIAQTGAEGQKVIMDQRLKRIKAQEAVDSGGGSFTRAGG